MELLNLRDRARLLDIMAAEMPLAFTAGARALEAWSDEWADGHITIKSATGRDVAFYLGPARRYFSEPSEVLQKNRGRIALLVRRSIIRESWQFAPFDRGELLYHWRHGHIHIEGEHAPNIVEELQGHTRKSSELSADFRKFLDEGYEDPLDYLCSWCPPRPSLEFTGFTNAVYRAGSDRLFGRVRGFSPAWTFEVSTADQPIEVQIDEIIAAVVVEDDVTRGTGLQIPLKDALHQRYHGFELRDELLHPDLPPLILEAGTSRIIKDRLLSAMNQKLLNGPS